ncbi:class I SAM-dependent methyltransferase, partial [Streptomyces griseoaurantiacus]
MATGAEFDAGYLRWRASEAHAALIGEGLPTRVQPFSFVPLAGLASVLDALALSPGQTLVDLGCGRGGPGLWLAEQARARLIGVDASRVAVADARQRQHLFPTVPHACFTVAEVATTGLPDACAHAVVSIDVLQLVDDQPAMAREAVRLLRPGGRLALTTWEGSGSAPQRFPRDLAGLLADAGLRVDAIVEQPAWAKRQY